MKNMGYLIREKRCHVMENDVQRDGKRYPQMGNNSNNYRFHIISEKKEKIKIKKKRQRNRKLERNGVMYWETMSKETGNDIHRQETIQTIIDFILSQKRKKKSKLKEREKVTEND